MVKDKQTKQLTKTECVMGIMIIILGAILAIAFSTFLVAILATTPFSLDWSSRLFWALKLVLEMPEIWVVGVLFALFGFGALSS
ncbi:hypothetical protein [Streptococcus sp. S784/96/1]|uniref:hypothetical protein n=1 Tax=Streptococcus sp. S784/96/1 TaxID=2653499 RepID=UPI00138986E8|nr:hypothetical protein [Streptococcus sp. S784/96/1]